MSMQAHVAFGISATTASVSLASWLTDHAVYFTVISAIAATMAGIAGFFLYVVQAYYKIKNEKRGK